jgi:hypothetical protein
LAAGDGIEHPSGNDKGQAIGKFDKVAVLSQPSKAPQEMNLAAIKRMMMVAYLRRRR